MKKSSVRLFFKAFSNETRLKMINILRNGPKSVTEICDASGFEQSRVSHNLKCLENCGFVNARRDGKNRIYELDKEHILPILRGIDGHMEKYEKRLESCEVLK